jgi:hypothetical protein
MFILALVLGTLFGCETLQGRQAPTTSIDSVLSVSASSLDFGTVVIGNSGHLSEIVTNRGTRAVTILQATVTNPEFIIVAPSFPRTISAGESIRIAIRFTPQSTGSLSGVIAIAGAHHSTTVTLKGTAVLPGKVAATPSSLRFGRVLKGKTQTRTETFTNTGSTNITVSQASINNNAFQLSGPLLPILLPPTQSAVFTVSFTPQGMGPVSGSLSVSSSASLVASNRSAITSRVRRHGSSESNTAIPLEGMGVGTGQLAASPANLSFGTAQPGNSMTKPVTLTNAGTSPLQINQASVSGAGFRLNGMNLPVSLQAGQSTTVSVVFSPLAAGNQNGSLTIVSDGSSPVTLVSLSGNAPTAPNGTLNSNLAKLSFGSVQVGGSKSQSGILTNSGNATVTISQASVNGNGFNGSGLVLPLKLSAGQSTAFTVTYAPTAAGNSTGTLTIASDASNTNLAVSLSGTATTPVPGVLVSSLSALNFGSIELGKTKTQSEVLTNTGATAVTVSLANLTGSSFSMSGLSLPAKLEPGQSASFTVTYSPTSAGNNSGAINLTSDASNPTVAVSLSGTATAVPSPAILAPSLGALAFGSIQVGTTKSQIETLTNTGGSPVTISQVKVSGAGFSVVGLPLPLRLNAAQSAHFTVSYSPTSAGESTGSLVLASDASNPSLATSLSGTAYDAPDPGVLTATAASLNFGSVQTGNNKSQSETLKNTGGSTVTISRANLTGVGFSLDGIYLPLQLNAGESFTFSVVFAPNAAAGASGSLTLVSDASNTISPISLSGSGAAAGQLSVSPAGLSFGNVALGASKSLTTTLSALNSSVTISSGDVSDPEFSLTGASFPTTLSSGQSVRLTITFKPQSSGSASSSLSFATNTATATVSQTLAGSGIAALSHSVDLSWNPSNSGAGYLVYRGTKTGGPYSKLTPSAIASTSFTDNSVQSGATYFYVTTSVNSSGLESDDSNEVMASIPTP